MSDLQDGMLIYYQEQARASDVNVERYIARGGFDYRDYIYIDPRALCPYPVSSITAPSPSTAKEPSSGSEK